MTETSALESAIDKERKLFLANENTVRFIQKIIPTLEYRKMAAEKYFAASDYPASQDELFKMIEHCNKQLKELLGL